MFSPARWASKQLETTISDTREVLNVARPALQTSQLQHYGDLVLRLDDVLNRLYVPNQRHGVISTPKKYRDTDAIPIVTMARTQRPVLDKDFHTMNPRQLTAMTRQIEVRGLEPAHAAQTAESLNRIMVDRATSQPQPALAEIGGTAMIANLGGSYRAADPEQPSYLWNARPLVVMSKESAQGPTLPLDLLHEMIHVVQKEDAPLIEGDVMDNRARNELEAYHGSSAIEKAAYGPTVIPSLHGTIEMVRAQSNPEGTDPFAVQPVLDYGLEFVNNILKPPALKK